MNVSGPARDSVRFGQAIRMSDFGLTYSRKTKTDDHWKVFGVVNSLEHQIHSPKSPKAPLFAFLRGKDFKSMDDLGELLEVDAEKAADILEDTLGLKVEDPKKGVPEFIQKLVFIEYVLGFSIKNLAAATPETLERIAEQFDAAPGGHPQKISLKQLTGWFNPSKKVFSPELEATARMFEERYGIRPAGDFIAEPFARDFILPQLFGLNPKELSLVDDFYGLYFQELLTLMETGNLERFKKASVPEFAQEMALEIKRPVMETEQNVVRLIKKTYGYAPNASPSRRIEIAEFLLGPIRDRVRELKKEWDAKEAQRLMATIQHAPPTKAEETSPGRHSVAAPEPVGTPRPGARHHRNSGRHRA